MEKNDPVALPIRPQKLILDADATIDDCEYKGEYIGEYREDSAENLIKRFPKKKEYISDKVDNNLYTKIKYIE